MDVMVRKPSWTSWWEPFAMDVKVRNPLPWTSYDVRRTEEGLVYRFASVSFFDETLVTV